MNYRKYNGSHSRIERTYTDGCKTLHTQLVKHYNDLLDMRETRQVSERSKDEVTCTSMLGTFLYTLWDIVCQASRKNIRGDFWEKVKSFGDYIKMHFIKKVNMSFLNKGQ